MTLIPLILVFPGTSRCQVMLVYVIRCPALSDRVWDMQECISKTKIQVYSIILIGIHKTGVHHYLIGFGTCRSASARQRYRCTALSNRFWDMQECISKTKIQAYSIM